MERLSAPAALPETAGRSEETFYITPVVAEGAKELVRERVKEMAHSRDGVASGSAPTPSPSGSGQSSTHMDLTHSDRAAGDGASEAAESEQSTNAGSVSNPIDLTQEDNALQKALALSLQEMQHTGTQISLEDQDLSRALEASLTERGGLNQLGLSLTGISVDPLNPHERRRQGRNPVGLKNIGNTCWFSAVIQSLFHIPEFRSVVLQFQPPALPPSDQSYHHCLLFLLELRRLFALMVATQRKYINPQKAIQALKAAFTEQAASVTAVQQDVSEFTHKLLEWIEIAFKTAAGNNDHNPVVKLFTGHCRTEGLLEGQTFVNESDFGAFPIQVQGHTHLHDSLEAACVNSEMGQETWFTALPPILVLELSRFSFNQSSSMVEKLHSRLKFDLTLSMDRYLEQNRDEVRQRRKEVATLKHKLLQLRKRLNGFTHYQGHSVSIQEILQLTLDFASEQSSMVRGNVAVDDGRDHGGRERGENEEGTGEKCPRMSVGPEPRYISPDERGTLEQCLMRWKSEVEEDISDLREGVSSTEDSLSAVYSDEPMNSTVYHLHAVLVHQGQASGGHYWSYVRKPPSLHVVTATPTPKATPTPTVAGTEALKLSRTLSNPETGPTNSPTMSTESSVGGRGGEGEGGEGQVQSVDKREDRVSDEQDEKEKKEDMWLKFNDVSVHELDWAEVMKESYGGHHNTSAYCLIYLSPLLHQAWANNDGESVLQPDLQYIVDEDNAAFRQEIAEYDARKERDRLREVQEEVAGSGQSQVSLAPVGGATSDHARPVGPKHDRSPEQMQVDSPPLPPIDSALTTELQTQVQAQFQRLGGEIVKSRRLSSGRARGKDGYDVIEVDTVRERLSSICSYIILSGLIENERVAPVLHVLLLQAVEKECEGGGKEELRLLAKKEIVTALVKPGVQQLMNELRELHHRFKIITHHFVYGVHCQAQRSLENALVHSVYAYKMNCQLIENTMSEKAGLQPLALGLLRNRALLDVSDGAIAMFDRGQVRAALETATILLVPTLKSMSELPYSMDNEVMERVREDWCNCLTHPSLSSAEQDQLADLLTRMFEEFSKSPDLTAPPAPSPLALDSTSLSSDYANVIQQFRKS